MGQLADHAAKRSEHVSDYYAAALQHIDQDLHAGNSLDEIIAAAARRQRWLRQHPTKTTAEELAQLTEALMFVQRVRRASRVA